MVKRYKGGLMSSSEATTSINSAAGMWNVVQATQSRYSGNWPSLLSTETPGSGGAGSSVTVSNVAVTDGSYTVLDDTPNISTAGGFIRVIGTGFASGCVVYIGGTAATTTTFVSSTEVRAVVPAASSNTLMVYVVNPNGSTGIKLNSLVFSGTPSWVTGATLSSVISDVAFSVQLSATSDSSVSYSLAAGSSLPPGTSLSSGGVFSGTVTGILSDTAYSFTVIATDAENQDTSRAFTVTVSTGDQYFNLTPLLLNGEASVWTRDSGVNNVALTVTGDARPSAFSPYNTSWSGYFDGGSDYITVAGDSNLAFGTGDWAIEYFICVSAATQGLAYDARPSGTSASDYIQIYGYNGVGRFSFVVAGATRIQSDNTITLNRWYHFVLSRVSGVTRMFVDGVQQTSTYTDSITYLNGASRPLIGANGGNSVGAESLNGYISNLRVLKGTGYTSVTIPTSKLTAIANTQLLTLQDNRFKDNSANAYTITKTNDAATRSFSPFADTDTTSGAGYFDGNGDYLGIANTSIMNFGTGAYTVEFWYWGDPSPLVYQPVVSTGSGGFRIFVGYGSGVSVWNSATPLLGSGSVLLKNTWNFVQVIRSSTASNGLIITVNGTSYTGGTDATNWGAAAFNVGFESASSYLTGYLADLRISDTARTVAIPTSNFTSDTNTKFLTLQYRRGDNNHRFIDEAGPKALIARNGNASQGSFSPYSPAGWSTYFAGTTDYLQVASTTFFNFGTGDFSFEVWGYAFSWPNVWRMITTSQPFTVNGGSNGIAQIDLGSGGVSTGITLPLNTWFHFAVTRQSGTVRAFLNGVLSYTVANATNFSTTGVAYIGGIAGFTQSWHGYLSNMRVVNGSVPTSYQTSSTTISATIFTPPTSALSLNSQGQSGATVFLTNHVNRFIDGNTIPLTITIGNTPRIQAFSPFRPSGTYVPATHGGSLYIDGTGDYLDYTSPPTLTIGTGDFTIEFWVYGLAAAAWWCYDSRPGGDGQYPLVYWDATSFVYYINTGARITSTAINIVGQWTHVVVSRVSGSTRMFVNGTVQSTVYSDTIDILNPGSSRPRIGLNGLNGLGPSTGYLSGLRVSTGAGVTSVTVPTAPPSFNANTAILNNFTNAGIYDATGRHNFETLGDAKISNVASKFGTGSLYFDGSSDGLYQLYNPQYAFGSGDFTIEFWINQSVKTGLQTIVAFGYVPITQNGWTVQTADGTGNIIFYYHNAGGAQVAIATESGSTVNTGTWYHIAVVRTGGNTRIYRNGTQVATGADTTVYSPATTVSLYIGGGSYINFGNYFVNGYLDDLRITRYARYTSAFTPPTSTHLTK